MERPYIKQEEKQTKPKRKAAPGGKAVFVNLPRNWIHQAITYMDTGELVFRLVLEAVEFVAVTALLLLIFPGATSAWAAIIAAFVIVHTANWIFNGLFWTIIIFAFPSLKNPGEKQTLDYLNEMARRLDASPSITGLAIYGSLSRGKWHDRSDIDLRLLRAPGIMNLIRAALLTMKERLIALLTWQPIDLYLADDVDFLGKMREDEAPLFLIKRDERLDKMYPGSSVQVLTSLTGSD